MPSFNIHLAIAKRYMDKHNDIKDKLSFYKGSIAPDLVDDKKISHYTPLNRESRCYSTYLLKKVILSDYLKENEIKTDYDKGIFLHLIADKLFFLNFFDINMLDKSVPKEFLKKLYYSYDLLNDYLNKHYVNIYDIFDNRKLDDIFEKYKQNTKQEIVIEKDRIIEFIEKVSDIDLEEYKNKVLNDDVHEMKLNSNAFDRMKNKIKIREYRVNDEKRRKVKRGDIITFRRLPDLDENLRVIVTKVETFSDFKNATSLNFKEDFSDRYKNVDELVESFYTRGYYKKEEVEKYGTVVFTIERID